MLYVFTNRRRAKDSIMLIAERYGTNDMMVFVKDGLVYVNMNITVHDIIMHYAQPCPGNLEDYLKLEDIEELYRYGGILKFRV